jgi:polar amino acid transport system substrate-binding protein
MRSVLTLLVLLFAPIFAARAEVPAVVFQSTETPPYWSPRLPQDGFAGSILHLLSVKAGIPYRIDYLPIKRFRVSESAYLVGDPDLISNAKNRVILPIASYRLAFMYYKPRHPKLAFKGLRALRGYTMGVMRGTVDDMQTFTRNGIKVEESDNHESLIRKLKKGRIDFCIVVEGTGLYTIAKEFPQEIDNFAVNRIANSSHPITLMIDTTLPYGQELATRYRKVWGDTLRSSAYAKLLENYYGINNVPAAYVNELFKFAKTYDEASLKQ